MEAFKRPPLFETKPATEWLLGAPVQKVSPRYVHGLVQRLVAERLGAWAEGRGRVSVEWRFWLTPPGERPRYLVPDVAYLSYERLPAGDLEAAEEPEIAPDAVFEIRSRGDREPLVAHKVDVYLRSNSTLVAVVDPYERTLTAYDARGVWRFAPPQVFAHSSLPEFELSLTDLFAKLDR